ncbi:MAG: Flp family type IVb pilin [Phycisphaerales bacterium]|nr:MAG: Flp family type IVb pilin [Phycisphaerales bacterium]
MTHVAHEVRRFLVSEAGPTTVEYALLLALVGVAVIIGATQLGQTVREIYTMVAERIEDVTR